MAVISLTEMGKTRRRQRIMRSVLEMLKFETNVRFPIGEIKYTPTHEVWIGEEWSSYR